MFYTLCIIMSVRMKLFHVKKKWDEWKISLTSLKHRFSVHSQYGISFIYLFIFVSNVVEHRNLYFPSQALTFESGFMVFSAITFQVGSPILPMAASGNNLSTDASHVAGIISRYHHTELVTYMRCIPIFVSWVNEMTGMSHQ
jgi:hypothetical protein